jgi:hypothetical protein
VIAQCRELPQQTGGFPRNQREEAHGARLAMMVAMKPLWIAASVAGIAAVGIASLSIHVPETVQAQAAPQAVGALPAEEVVTTAPAAQPEPLTDPAPLQRVDANACVFAQWESRYRNLAYDHIVTLNNQCGATVDCEIMTLDEAAVNVTLLSRSTKEVAFRQGSRERELRAWMQCTR